MFCSKIFGLLFLAISVNASIMGDGSMSFSGASQPLAHLPSQFTSLSSIATSQTEYEPVDLVCSEDSSSLGAYRSFHRVPRDADIDITNDENTTNFCLGNSGEFLHRVHLVAFALAVRRILTFSRLAHLTATAPPLRHLAIT
jgi:hypothetical protein